MTLNWKKNKVLLLLSHDLESLHFTFQYPEFSFYHKFCCFGLCGQVKSRCRSPLLKPPWLCEAQKADCHASSGCSTGFISVMSPVSLFSCYLSILMDGLWIEAQPPHYDLYAFKILAQLNYVDWLNKWINVSLIPGTWACRLTERTNKRKTWGYGQEDFFLLGIWGWTKSTPS